MDNPLPISRPGSKVAAHRRSRPAGTGFSHRRFVSTLCFASVCLFAPHALAQDEYCGDPDDESYVELMNAARVAIEAADFDTALANFMLAYREYQPGILEFALARTYHHLERYDEALDHYNRFLRHYAQCPDPEGLMETAEEYRALAVREQMAATEIPRTPTESESSIHPGVWVVGAGGSLLLSGLIFDLAKSGIDDDIAAAYDANDTQQAHDLLNERDTARTIDWVLYGAGAATLVTGVILLLVLEPEQTDEFAVNAGPARDGWAFSLRGRF